MKGVMCFEITKTDSHFLNVHYFLHFQDDTYTESYISTIGVDFVSILLQESSSIYYFHKIFSSYANIITGKTVNFHCIK